MARIAKSRPLFVHQSEALTVIERAAKDLTPASFAIFRESLDESLDVAESNAEAARIAAAEKSSS